MKLFTRIVAVLLVLCLIADPAMASAFNHPLSPTWERAVAAGDRGEGAESTFLKQALSLPAEAGPVNPLDNSQIKVATNVALEAPLGIPAKPEPAPDAEPVRGQIEVVHVNLSEHERNSSYVLPDLHRKWANAVATDKKLLIGLETSAFLPHKVDQSLLREQIKQIAAQRELSNLSLPDLLEHPNSQAALRSFFRQQVLRPWQQRRDHLMQLYLSGDVPAEGGPTQRMIHVFVSKAMQDRAHLPKIVLPEPDFEAWRLELLMQTYQRLIENAWADGDLDAFFLYGNKLIPIQARRLQRLSETTYHALESGSTGNTLGLFIQTSADPLFIKPQGQHFEIVNPSTSEERRRRFDDEYVEAIVRGRQANADEIADCLKRGVIYSFFAARLLELYPRLEEEVLATIIMPIVDRWSAQEMDDFIRLPNSEMLSRGTDWLLRNGSADERAQFRIGPGLTQTEFSYPWPDAFSIEKPFGDQETVKEVPGARRVIFHYFSPLHDILEQTNPRVLRRIEKILITPFDELVEGVDYDMLSGGRSVLVFVDWPIRVNGRLLASFKVKAGVYDPSVFGQAFDLAGKYNYMLAPRQGIHKSDGMKPLIESDGRYRRIPRQRFPIGGTLLSSAREEVYTNLRGLGLRLPLGFPLAFIEFPDHSDPSGQLTGAAVIGLPMADNSRGGDYIPQLNEYYGSTQEFLMAMAAMLTQHGRTLRHLNDVGLALRNFHITNATFLDDGEEFVHDTEDSHWRENVTPSEYFGHVLVGLRDVVFSFLQFEQFPMVASLPIAWIPQTLLGYFHDQAVDSDLAKVKPQDFANLLRDGEIPFLIDHPIIRRLLNVMQLDMEGQTLRFRGSAA